MRYSIAALLRLLCFLLLISSLQSCDPGDPGVWRNEKIKSGERDDLHHLNDKLFKAVTTDDNNDAQNLLSKDMLENSSTTRLLELVGNHLKANKYSILDEYYIINKQRGIQIINTDSLKLNAYTLNYEAVTQEMYMAFYIPKGTEDKWMITTVYAKYDYGWRLYKLSVEKYTISGKTAPELYKQANEQYNKGYLADAVNTMQLATDCMLPNKDIWAYPGDRDMRIFYGKLVEEANEKYRFPLTIKQVASQPQIFRIVTQTIPGGTYPIIYYKSKINLKDTTALKTEHAAIKKVIGNVIAGIDKDKKHLLYSVFNEMPSAKKTVPSYDITDKL